MFRKCLNRARNGYEYLKDWFCGIPHLAHRNNADMDESIKQPTALGKYLRKSSSGTAVSSKRTFDAILQNPSYNQWLKVVLALRLLNEFLAPLVEMMLKELQQSLIEKFREDDERPLKNTTKTERKTIRGLMIEEVRLLHRQPVTPKEIARGSDVSLWLSENGKWEVAKVFFGHTQRKFSTDNASCLDFSKLLSFMVNCKLADAYLDDFRKCFAVLEVRNKTMHSTDFQISSLEKDQYFEILFKFIDSMVISEYVLAPEIEQLQNQLKFIQSSLIDIRILQDKSSDLIPSARSEIYFNL